MMLKECGVWVFNKGKRLQLEWWSPQAGCFKERVGLYKRMLGESDCIVTALVE